MTTLAYSHTLVAGTPENINDVQDMFNDVKTWANGNIDATNLAASADPATVLGAYRTIHEATVGFTSGVTAGTFIPVNDAQAGKIGVATAATLVVCPINVADYAVSGLTTQFRMQASTITNPTAPAVNFTFAPAIITGFSGAAGSISIASVTGLGASVVRTAPALSTGFVDTTADFTISSNGVYVLTVALSGAPAANSWTNCTMRLQVHHI